MNLILRLAVWVFFIIFVVSCGTITGNPIVRLNFSSYTHSSKLAKVDAVTRSSSSNYKFCFKRLRFKRAEDSTLSENVDYEIGLVSLDPDGTFLSELQVPVGTYRRVEFDLADDCGKGYSVYIDNGLAGTPFSTTDTITIRFEGELIVTEETQEVDLLVQNIVDAMADVTNSANIKTELENVTGGL